MESPRTAEQKPERAAASPRTEDGKGVARATRRRPPIHSGSTAAIAGSHHSFGQAAPFGSSVSRCSPSATFAHMLPNHTNPHVTPTSSSSLPKHRLPNRKWQPPELSSSERGACSNLGSVMGTPVSDRLAAKNHDGAIDDSESVDGSTSLSSRKASSVTSAASIRSAAAAERRARPPSAGDEQRLSRRMRDEITRMRDEKLALKTASQLSTPRDAVLPSSRVPHRSPVQPLGEIARSITWTGKEDPLDALRRMQGRHEGTENRVANGNLRPLEASSEAHTMSLERASLLSFIAGEVRRR